MKRFVAILLVFSIVMSLPGCYVNTDGIKDAASEAADELVDDAVDYVEEEIDNAVADVKANVINKLNSEVNALKEAVSKGINDAKEKINQTKNSIMKVYSVRYIAADATNVPAVQYTSCTKRYLRISNQIPVREGYRFLGWGTSRNSTEVVYSPGQRWVRNEKSIILYAVWEEYTHADTDNSGVHSSKTELKIKYDPNGGMGGPTEQTFKENARPKISKETPTRPGYHFIGWTCDSLSNEPIFFSGKKTKFALSGDIVLYACWEAYDPNYPIYVKENKGTFLGINWVDFEPHEYTFETKGNIIRITCECGFELIDRNIDRDKFVEAATNGDNKNYDSLRWNKKDDYERYYQLYRTQDFAPVAIALISSFYKSFEAASQDFNFNKQELKSYLNSYDYDASISSLSDFF